MTTPNSGAAMTPAKSLSRIERIAALNDGFRAQRNTSNTYVTLDLVNRGDIYLKKLLEQVRDTSKPIPAEDTDDERSYGSVRVNGLLVEWSVNYFDRDGYDDSPDPSDASVTSRTLVLTQA